MFLVFDAVSTLTKDSKIKPDPYFALKFSDYVNLPENFNVSINFFDWNHPWKKNSEIFYSGIENRDVTISNEHFKPDTEYMLSVSFLFVLPNFFTLYID